MTTEKPGLSRRTAMRTLGIDVPVLGVITAANVVGAQPAVAAPLGMDGWWGSETTRALQRAYNLLQTGIIGFQPASREAQNPGLTGGWHWVPDTQAQSSIVGAPQDGLIGPVTIRAMQARYGVPQDGYLSSPSLTIRRFQADLNVANGFVP